MPDINLASRVRDDERPSVVCHCERCETDGAHDQMCAVHCEPPGTCDCPRSDMTPILTDH
jgi:hypothetical protein